MGKCPERSSSQTMERRIALIQDDEASSAISPMGKDGPVQEGEILMLRKTLLKLQQPQGPPQRKTLFRTT